MTTGVGSHSDARVPSGGGLLCYSLRQRPCHKTDVPLLRNRVGFTISATRKLKRILTLKDVRRP